MTLALFLAGAWLLTFILLCLALDEVRKYKLVAHSAALLLFDAVQLLVVKDNIINGYEAIHALPKGETHERAQGDA